VFFGHGIIGHNVFVGISPPVFGIYLRCNSSGSLTILAAIRRASWPRKCGYRGLGRSASIMRRRSAMASTLPSAGRAVCDEGKEAMMDVTLLPIVLGVIFTVAAIFAPGPSTDAQTFHIVLV
jgi:hypothetical protein